MTFNTNGSDETSHTLTYNHFCIFILQSHVYLVAIFVFDKELNTVAFSYLVVSMWSREGTVVRLNK